MDAFSNMVRREIEAEGGTIETFIGDAVVAVFGGPVAHDDDATRALHAALRIRASLADLNLRMHELYGLTLEVHSGINMGLVVAETNPRPGARMITGVAVNIAQRLEESADPGQIRVSARAASAARGFQLVEIGPLPLRSIEEPAFVYELVAEAPLEGGGWPIIRTPIVGRQRELTLLDSVFDRVASDGRPHLATIYGDPGVGKSRLVAEFCLRASRLDRPPRVVRGRCLPSEASTTYGPLAEILKRDTDVLDSDPPRLALQKIGVRGRELLSSAHTQDPDRAIAALCLTMGLQPPDARAEETEPRRIHAEISTA